MINETQMEYAEEIVNQVGVTNEEDKIKRIKTIDRGLIERTESSKTILNEDNKQVLFG